MGLVKTRRPVTMHPPPPATFTVAEAKVDESADKEAAARRWQLHATSSSVLPIAKTGEGLCRCVNLNDGGYCRWK